MREVIVDEHRIMCSIRPELDLKKIGKELTRNKEYLVLSR